MTGADILAGAAWRELAVLCKAAAKLPGWAAPIPETPDGSWPPIPPTALAKRRLTGRCNDAAPAVSAALRALVLPTRDASHAPDLFDVCTNGKRYLIFTTYLDDETEAADYADSRTAPTALVASVPIAAGKPAGKPTLIHDEHPGPFADFDGDGVPELATWRMRWGSHAAGHLHDHTVVRPRDPAGQLVSHGRDRAIGAELRHGRRASGGDVQPDRARG